MLFGWKLGHIRSKFHDDRLRQRHPKPMHHRNIHAADALQMLANVCRILWGVLAVRVALLRRQRWQLVCFPIGARHGIQAINLCVATLHLLGVKIVQLQRLLDDKEMFLAPGPRQRLADLFRAFLQRRSRNAANFCGSRSPATMARIIACPVSPVTSLNACDNCTFICNNAF